MKIENSTNYELINKLYMEWLNEQEPFVQRKRKEEIKSKVSRYDLLMYSIRFAMPFQAFRDIFSLSDLFKTLEEMEKRGEDITAITNQTLSIQGIEDIQGLNQFSQKGTITNVGNFRLRFEGSSLFEFGDIKNIGKKFPYACVNYFDIEKVEQIAKEEKDYKGIPIIITIDNMGELTLEKLSDIEKKFDVAGVRIIEKDREARKYSAEQRPISLMDYKQIRSVVDDEIINRLFVTEHASKIAIDSQLAIQIFCIIVDKIKYNSEFKSRKQDLSMEEYIRLSANLSNITGLVTGETMCGGYSEILRNVLSCVGIKSKTIIGETANDGYHAWNQVELGNTWFNTDLTWARKQICEGKPTGDLFMSDSAFFGDRRNFTFEQGQQRNGISMETTVLVGGHTKVHGNNSKRCESYFTPYLTATLIERAREYDNEYKRYGKLPNYKGAIPYVRSSIEKMRTNSKSIEIPIRP